jgi:hypothetical protein
VFDNSAFGDGRVKQVLAIWKNQENSQLGIVIVPGGWTTLEDLQRKGQLDWTGIIDLCAAEHSSGGIRILGGERGQGGDGFVPNLRSDCGAIV